MSASAPPPGEVETPTRRPSMAIELTESKESRSATPARVAEAIERGQEGGAAAGARGEARPRIDSFVAKKNQNFDSILMKKTQTRKGAGNKLTLYFKEGAAFGEHARSGEIFQTGTDSSHVEVTLDSAKKDAAALRSKPIPPNNKDFGTWDGVCVSCLLNIFGVIMFLRVGFVVGHAGWVLAIGIMLLSTVVTLITTWSMSAIVTNGEVKGGGAYYLISRSLGAAFGGSIGALFFVGLACAIALYVIGFTEVLTGTTALSIPFSIVGTIDPDNTFFGIVDVVTGWFGLTGGQTLNDMRIYSLILICFLLCMALIGVGWVINVQIGLLVMLVCAIISISAGSFWSRDAEIENGFVGWKWDNIIDNAWPDYGVTAKGEQLDFIKVFAIFFPAVTGIMAGANISGLLKNPAENIPKGTFTAIIVSTIVYAALAFVLGATCTRTGLKENMSIMANIEVAQQYLVLAGIYAATFSSALASLVGAPQVLASVAQDRIFDFPFINYFGVTHARKKGSLFHTRCPFVEEATPSMVANILAVIGVKMLHVDPLLIDELEAELKAQAAKKKDAVTYDRDLRARVDDRRKRVGGLKNASCCVDFGRKLAACSKSCSTKNEETVSNVESKFGKLCSSNAPGRAQVARIASKEERAKEEIAAVELIITVIKKKLVPQNLALLEKLLAHIQSSCEAQEAIISQCLVNVAAEARDFDLDDTIAAAAGSTARATVITNLRVEMQKWLKIQQKRPEAMSVAADELVEEDREQKTLQFLKDTMTVCVVDVRAGGDDGEIPQRISIAKLVPKRPDMCGCRASGSGPQPKDIKGYVSDLSFMGILALFESDAGQDNLDVESIAAIAQRLEDIDGDITYGNVIPTAAGDPVRGYFVSFTLACVAAMIGDLNAVGPLISMFFMMTYGLVNFAVFVLDTSRSPAWRPAFICLCDCSDKFRWITSLAGAIICLVLMILIDQTYAIIALVIGAAVYFLIDVKMKHNAMDVKQFGSALDTQRFTSSLNGVLSLRTVKSSDKTYRPNFLMLASLPKDDNSDGTALSADAKAEHALFEKSGEQDMLRFAHTLRKGYGMFLVGNIIHGDPAHRDSLTGGETAYGGGYFQLDDRDYAGRGKKCNFGTTGAIVRTAIARGARSAMFSTIKGYAVVSTVVTQSIEEGAMTLMQCAGLGALRPNVLMLPLSPTWMDKDTYSDGRSSIQQLFNIIRQAITTRMGAMLIRNMKVDFNKPMDKPDEPKSVDLYWLVDDGGLSVLIPYLMVKTQYWRYRLGRKGMGNGGAIRIFLMTNSDLNEGAEAVGEEESLRQKLKEYRLDAVCTVMPTTPLQEDVLDETTRELQPWEISANHAWTPAERVNGVRGPKNTKSKFRSLVREASTPGSSDVSHEVDRAKYSRGAAASKETDPFALVEEPEEEALEGDIVPNDENDALVASKDEEANHIIRVFLRVSEIMNENSSPQETGVVYVTLPMPRSSMTAAEYFSVIELLTVKWENCPTVFIRGNARDCLTGFWDPQFSADAEGGRRDEAENFDISAARDPSASEARAESGLAQQRDD